MTSAERAREWINTHGEALYPTGGGMYDLVKELLADNERMRGSMREATALIENVFTEADEETRSYYSEWKYVLNQCKKALEGEENE